MLITAKDTEFAELNSRIRLCSDADIELKDVVGQRYIGCGIANKKIKIHGTPGNALGAYMNGGILEVCGNAQDATGDTMNCGRIIIHGNCGDATGYGMRGGEIYIKADAGYRLGIHMKEYHELKPVIVVGGKTGDFLGEYQAGGIIIVLGIGCTEEHNILGDYCGTGMHGGVIYSRKDKIPADLPAQVNVAKADADDLAVINKYIKNYCRFFNIEQEQIMSSEFIKLTANTKNPYKLLYTYN